jgi:hypothetical protein
MPKLCCWFIVSSPNKKIPPRPYAEANFITSSCHKVHPLGIQRMSNVGIYPPPYEQEAACRTRAIHYPINILSLQLFNAPNHCVKPHMTCAAVVFPYPEDGVSRERLVSCIRLAWGK